MVGAGIALKDRGQPDRGVAWTRDVVKVTGDTGQFPALEVVWRWHPADRPGCSVGDRELSSWNRSTIRK
jgi:hypothetical protein